jgi:microcystin-dependent protein
MAKYDDRDYIGDIVVSDPPGTEDLNLGDNAIRSLARALKNAFPNSTGADAYTGNLSDLNGLVGGAIVPKDCLMQWAGDQTTFPNGPDGWTICDGRLRGDGVTLSPDLRGMFVIGSQPDGDGGNKPESGDTGGNTEVDIRNSNGSLVVFETEETTLTEAQIGSHSHPMFTTQKTDGDAALGADDLVAYWGFDNSSDLAYKAQPSTFGTATLGKTGPSGAGSAQGHKHSFSIDGSSTNTWANVPPFFAALYIIKD